MLATPRQSLAGGGLADADGEETIAQLAHRRLHATAVAFHRAGWEHYLPRLALVAAGSEAGIDRWRDPAVVISDLRTAGVRQRDV
jgi:hypothetical protein